MTIGLTGPIGSGKSQVAAIWRKCGLHVIDCDVVYRELLTASKVLQRAVLGEFPSVDDSGKINRAKLAEIVFNNADALARLEAVTHLHIAEEVAKKIADIDGDVVIEAIALLKSDIVRHCDCIVSVTAPPALRIQRVVARDNLTVEQVQARINAQPDDVYYREESDYCIENDGTELELRKNALKILEYCRSAQPANNK
ncbi:MAG: dephospho-CoA kinase [Oscillospiraceae bacterium]|nr:dephospho-CoA kinase [Oscillospiraceae bacterium]